MQLVLTSFGTSLSRDNEGFVVSDREGRQRVPVESVSSILIGKGVSVSSDAMMLATENEIIIQIVDRSGMPISQMWSPKFGSISTIRKGQIDFSKSKDALEWIKGILAKKINNQKALIQMMPSHGMKQDNLKSNALLRVQKYLDRLMALEGELVQEVAPKIRGLEGSASKVFFEVYSSFLPEQYRFDVRTQHPAMDIANAMLNYGYGMLYGKVEAAMLKSGIDPYVGVLHRNEYNRPVLVFDFMEMYRVWVDFIVFSILSQEVVNDDFYSVNEDGSVWLEPLGRRIMIQGINDYFDEVVIMNNLSRSRESHMELAVQKLAQKFKSYA